MFKTLFNRQWWWTTLLVIAAMAVMVRLGVWQLERHAARRAFNARVSEQMAAPPLTLQPDSSTQALADMEYRAVTVTGVYDFASQVALRNQSWDDGQATLRAGVHLLTPLVVDGANYAVLVDRGWIPLADSAPAQWAQFEALGRVTVQGVIRRSQSRGDFGSITDPAGPQTAWNLVNLPRLAEQMPYELLPVYIQQTSAGATPTLPHPAALSVDLSEGSHFGYALQWFAFALVLGIGYPFFVRQNARPTAQVGQPQSVQAPL